jgi:hypothetical protein
LTETGDTTTMAGMEESGSHLWDLRVIGAIGAALLIVALAAFLWLDPRRAGELVTEDGPVEWAQAGLLLAGLAVTVPRTIRRLARGQSAATELLFGALLLAAITVELSLHSWVGFRIRHWRPSLRRSAGPVFPWVVLALSLIVALAAVCHVIHHRRSLLPMARRLPRSRWGQLTIAGAAVYAVTLVFQNPIDHLMREPSYYLEESIELVGTLWLCLAACELARTPTGEDGEV